MSWAIEEMLNIVWCLGTDVEANILTDSALVGAKKIQSNSSGSKLGEGHAFLPGEFLFRNVDCWGTII